MYFNFTCSNCGKTLKVREELAGRRAKCPYCRAAVSVPDQSASEGASREDTEAGTPGPDATAVGASGTAGAGPATGKPVAPSGPTPALPQIAVGPRPSSSGPPAMPSRPRTRTHGGSEPKEEADQRE